MANEEQLAMLKEQGVDVWNKWREDNPDVDIELSFSDLTELDLREANLSQADLSEADLDGVDLNGANLSEADLSSANLSQADLSEADLSGAILIDAGLGHSELIDTNLSGANLNNADLGEANLLLADLKGAKLCEADLIDADLDAADLSKADLSGANLSGTTLRGAILSEANLIGAKLFSADLSGAKLCGAKLSGAFLTGANLNEADFSNANLRNADLVRASLIETNLTRSVLTDCNIYGISAWKVKLERAEQSNLVITPDSEPTVTVSNMKVAQFLYLLINNPEIRGVLDTITSKVVLILGRFTDERLSILNALRTELQKRDYIPVLFDFDAPKSRHIEETVSTLAHMAKFIIADITDPRAIPQELTIIVRNLQTVPVLPLLQPPAKPWGMYASIDSRSTVLPILEYSSETELIGKIQTDVIEIAEQKVIELAP